MAHIEKNHWEKELEKESLREPALKGRFSWIHPLTHLHALEFKGLDKRDFYEPPNYDRWDSQVWNVSNHYQNLCNEYAIDVNKCKSYLNGQFILGKSGMHNRSSYCWKVYDNLTNCKRVQ